MNKQELLKKLKAELDNKLGGNWNLAINTAILFAEQLDEPQIAECGVCEHLSALVNENAHQAEQIAILERALSNAINADESFDIEIDCEGEQCNTCFACAYHNYIHEADEQLKNEEFEVI